MSEISDKDNIVIWPFFQGRSLISHDDRFDRYIPSQYILQCRLLDLF